MKNDTTDTAALIEAAEQIEAGIKQAGAAYTEFEGSTASDFRRSLGARSTRAGGTFVWHREMTGVMRARTAYRWRKYVRRNVSA